MGNIFRRRRQATEELEEIVTCLKELESQVKDYMENRADILRTLLYGILVMWSVGSAYVWLHYRVLTHRVLALLGTFVLAVLIFLGLRLFLVTVYDFMINRKHKKIQFYTERKLTIIEDVKENEKFKVAKEIIQKYSTSDDLDQIFHPNASELQSPPLNGPALRPVPTPLIMGTGGRRSSTSLVESGGAPSTQRPATLFPTGRPMGGPSAASGSGGPSGMSASMTALGGNGVQPTSKLPKLHEIADSRRFARAPIRPFVEPSTNPVDRILDYVMGESINNRYALICGGCHAHNGMAMREEFEQISYFCFKCGCYNPSRNELNMSADQRQRGVSGLNDYSGTNFVTARSRTRTMSPFRRSSSHGLRTAIGPSRTPSIRSLAAITGEDYSASGGSRSGGSNHSSAGSINDTVDQRQLIQDNRPVNETPSKNASSGGEPMET